MFIGNINIWVLLIATVVGMAVGFIWYSPFLFQNLWLKSKGWTPEIIKEKNSNKRMWQLFLPSTIFTLVTAFVLGVLFNSIVTMGIWGIVSTALLMWIGFVVPVKLGDYLFGDDTFTFFLISSGHYLVSIVLMSLVIGIFS